MKLSNYPIVSKSRNKNTLLNELTRGTFIIRALIRSKQIGTTFRRKLRSAWSAPWCKHECNCGAVRYTLIRRVARIPSLPWPRRATLWSPLSGFQPCLVFSGVGNAAKITHANNVRQIMFKKKKKKAPVFESLSPPSRYKNAFDNSNNSKIWIMLFELLYF